MSFPSRRARIAMLTGVATLGIAGTASASSAVYTTDTNQLRITVDGAPGTDVVTCEGGFVKFNGADPTRVPDDGRGTTGCAASVSLAVDEPDKDTATANTLDLRGITRAEWTGLAASTAPFAINMGGGDDTVIGSEFAEVITPGKGNDNVNGNAGDDTMVWNPGEASDVMTGGDGRDVVVDNGGNVDEQFVIKPKDGDATRVDASRINPSPFTLDIDAERLQINGAGGNDSIIGNPGTAGLITTEMNGGDGNDVLVGTDGNDVMRGGAGNDSITGAKGNDDMGGDDGDDTLIWNPGDGSDKFEGGAGNDIAQDNGGAAAEHFVVSANGDRFTAARVDGAPFFLDIGTSEILDLNTAAGDDTVDVGNGLGAVKVDADLGEGNDSINARNDTAQTIDGGAGTDTAKVDKTDQVTNVEKTSGAGKTKAKIRNKSLKVKKGSARVKLSLPAGSPDSKGRIRIKRGGKIVGSKKFTMDEGRSTIRVPLKRSARVALAKDADKKLKAKLNVRMNGGAKSTKRLNLVG